MNRYLVLALTLTSFLLSSGCSYNIYRDSSQFTGDPLAAAAGAGVGAGGVALLSGPKTPIVIAGLAGAGVGYYLSTMRADAGGVLHAGGKVYQLGELVTVEIPTDQLFDIDTDYYLPQADTILYSAALVLRRFPCDNILVTGNTSGVALAKHERDLSLRQAKKVASYLWAHGVSDLSGETLENRKLIYVGYGNMAPISNIITAKGIGENRRIQITAFPSAAQLHDAARQKLINNVGAFEPTPIETVIRP